MAFIWSKLITLLHYIVFSNLTNTHKKNLVSIFLFLAKKRLNCNNYETIINCKDRNDEQLAANRPIIKEIVIKKMILTFVFPTLQSLFYVVHKCCLCVHITLLMSRLFIKGGPRGDSDTWKRLMMLWCSPKRTPESAELSCRDRSADCGICLSSFCVLFYTHIVDIKMYIVLGWWYCDRYPFYWPRYHIKRQRQR